MKQHRMTIIRTAACLIAAALILGATQVPLWTMTLQAPQYPNGLQLHAYGDRIEGDLREINIINHYIGMDEISERPAPEMKLFPWSIGALVLLILIAPLHRFLYLLGAVGAAALPVGILVDMQYWLHTYGHSLDPEAPIRQEPFTPLVLGTSEIGNFSSTTMISTGMVMMFAASALMLGVYFVTRRRERAASLREEHAEDARGSSSHTFSQAAGTIIVALLLALPAYGELPLQRMIDDALPGGTVELDGGVWQGPVEIRKSVELVGRNAPVIDGGGEGTVVLVEADDVVLRGLVIRNSGRRTTEEAAGIKITGNGHRVEGNRIEDVHFGIQALHGKGLVIQNNWIDPGRGRGYRAGDGINLWYLQDSTVRANRIARARDGIYLSFTEGILLENNSVRESRYGIHSMFSNEITVEGNTLRNNLLGAALMNSDRLVFRGNRSEMNREGATAYGILLKDIGELILERNLIARNRVGIYADNTPDRLDRQALIRHNSIIGNDAAFALQSSARLLIAENRISDNLSAVIAQGGRLSEANKWSIDGRGNFWSDYPGIDRDGDGIGDFPHEVTDAVDALVDRNPLVRAFQHSPAHRVIDLAARMFPLFRPRPLLNDPAPLVTPSAATPRY